MDLIDESSRNETSADVSYESDIEHNNNRVGKTRRAAPKRLHDIDWMYLKDFCDSQERENFIQSENCWSIITKTNTYNGIKTYYRCNLAPKNGPQCQAKLYIMEMHVSDEIKCFKAIDDHNHAEIKSRSIPVEVKSIIVDLHHNGMKPKSILRYLNEKFGENNHIRNVKQISNFLNYNKIIKYEQDKVSLGELIEWLAANSEVPADEDEPYIVQYSHSDYDSPEYYFRFISSTRRLLKLASKAKRIHVDSTYKLVWQGFPVLVIGNTDLNRKFHPYAIAVCCTEKIEDFEFLFTSLSTVIKNLFNMTFSPSVLVSDAASAIRTAFINVFGSTTLTVTCWAHVAMNVKKAKLATTKNRIEIKKDLNSLQLAANEDIFKKASVYFIQKWAQHEKNFCAYFEKVWLREHTNWYEGVSHFTPSTNNALESFNSLIKKCYTLRERHPLSRFKIVLHEMVKDLSLEYKMAKRTVAQRSTITIDLWREAVLWAKSHTLPISEIIDANNTLYFSPASHCTEFNELYVEKVLNADWNSFDEFKEIAFSMWCIKINNNDWIKNSTCTCPKFFKEYKCKHVLGIALRLKLVRAPPDANPDRIIAKPKRGRKPKAKKALIIQ